MSDTTARRHRSTILIVLGLLAGIAAVVLLGPRGTGNREPYDPQNANANGARAVANVLSDQGVERDIARSADQLEDLAPGAESVVVVTVPDRLGASTAQRLAHAGAHARVVLLDPAPGTMRLFGIDEEPRSADVGSAVRGACAEESFDALSVRVDEATAYPTAPASSSIACFGTDDGALLVEPRPGLVLLGAPELLTNDQVLRADNAAAALRLLGGADRVVWYVPDTADLAGEDAVSLSTLLPPWLAGAVLLLLLVAVALLLWRVRRFGPLAVEALPVEVPGTETVMARGRLYQRSGDRAHAASVLQRRTLDLARRHLQLGAVDDVAVVAAIAAHLEREPAAVDALLRHRGDLPTDASLTALADALADLDREVRTR